MSAQPSRFIRTPAGYMVLALFLVSPALWMRLTPNQYAESHGRDLQRRSARNTSAVAIMVGELRTGISDILLMKAECYLDSGIGYEPHGQQEQLGTVSNTETFDAHPNVARSAQSDAHDHHHDHDHDHTLCESDHAGTETLIAPPSRDYRGFIGHLHRRVKPWRDPSIHAEHADGTQMLPWIRIATLCDPHHIRAYTIGGYWLSLCDRETSLTFIREGMRLNPDAFQLHLIQGQIQFKQARSLGDINTPSPEQRVLLLKARDAFRAASELALSQRNASESGDSPAWPADQEHDAWSAFRLAVMTESAYGSPREAIRFGRRCLSVAGSDLALERILNDASPEADDSQAEDHSHHDHSDHDHGHHDHEH